MRPAELREAVEFVLDPEQHALSSALQKVREQRPEQAIRILENQANSGTRAVYWLKVLKFIQNASMGEEGSELAELVRICFPNLAFNPTMSQ